jgi:hypothetical protein
MVARKRNSPPEVVPMTDSILRTAFENVAAHISNLDTMKELIQELEGLNESIDHVIVLLEKKSDEAEVTFRTDIRILINECRHLMKKMTN